MDKALKVQRVVSGAAYLKSELIFKVKERKKKQRKAI
jgi:hypothetical protein